ncbi:MAG: hypothetical protein HOD92_25955 [Deltaproteobacteria bacterium]|jgi:hypothetical protein|nr:hypothetical protein [Deltaproteobacteria bacterium]MBT4526514.1 hypothetical protein [Deltaproteobacteria bacterium]
MNNENKNEFIDGAYLSTNSQFKSLTADEVREFQEHARENYTPNQRSMILGIQFTKMNACRLMRKLKIKLTCLNNLDP